VLFLAGVEDRRGGAEVRSKSWWSDFKFCKQTTAGKRDPKLACGASTSI
jgi:hypothetical protein